MGSDGLKVSQPAKGLAASSCSPGRGAGSSGRAGSEPGSEPGSGLLHVESTGSSVDDHLHPSGATYVPFAGSICFERAREGGARIRRACVGAGAARWVSPLLRYRETFSSSGGGALAAARELAARAGMDGVGSCSARGPVVFAVTNFDAASNASVPNFVDVPDPSRPMTVRSTYVRAVTLEWPDEAADDAFA